MVYRIEISKRVIKTLKKIKDKKLKEIIVDKIYGDIAHNPYNGDLKVGDLTNVLSETIKYSKVEYRIAYTVHDDIIQVDIVHIGTRENFYKELKNILK